MEDDGVSCSARQQRQICSLDPESLGTTHCGSAVGRKRSQNGAIQNYFYRGCFNCSSEYLKALIFKTCVLLSQRAKSARRPLLRGCSSYLRSRSWYGIKVAPSKRVTLPAESILPSVSMKERLTPLPKSRASRWSIPMMTVLAHALIFSPSPSCWASQSVYIQKR